MAVADTTPKVMQIFEKTGAYLKGHFRLTSGLHSPEYLQCARVLQHPKHSEAFGRLLSERFTACTSRLIDVVVAPAIGGLIIGHEVARGFSPQSTPCCWSASARG